MKITDGRGVDVFFEMSGAPPSFEEGFKVLRPGGTAVLFGLPSKNVEFDVANWIVFKDAQVRGVFGRRLWSTWYKTAEVLKAREVDLSKVDRKSTRLNSSHVSISYAVFCLKKKI